MRGGRLREVVAKGGSTVVFKPKYRAVFIPIFFPVFRERLEGEGVLVKFLRAGSVRIFNPLPFHIHLMSPFLIPRLKESQRQTNIFYLVAGVIFAL